jgi:hypothetical protein
MVITTKYNFDERIYINELKIHGIVLSIFVARNTRIQYLVRFFDGRDPKEVYFLENELSAQQEENGLGYKP